MPSSSDPRASSSSSSKSPSSSSKPSSSSSSSSSARPSSSSSSSSAPASAPPALQQGPFISANAWMSFFFLFCCLVLIILQGPLGLSGIGAPGFPAVGAVGAVGGLVGGGNGNFGGFGMNGWPSGLGVGIGCQGLAATYVPWCAGNGMTVAAAAAGPAIQIQQQRQGYQVIPSPQYLPQQAQAQVVHHHHGGPVVVRTPQTQGRGSGGYGGYGAQGSINLPGGGRQWSWGYDGQPRRQHHSYGYPQRQFQYQRPGLNVQVNQGGPPAAQAQIQGGYDYNQVEVDWTSQSYEYLCYHLPYLCQPIIPYAYAYAPPPRPQHVRRYAPYAQPYAQQRPYIAAQAQGPIVVPQQVVPVAQPVAGVQGMSPNTMMGIANLESAFFPLLVGAIALLVIFDYSS